ncbi:MAG: MHFG family PEP-CTERM protein [Gammaproteobacteria bacterium]
MKPVAPLVSLILATWRRCALLGAAGAAMLAGPTAALARPAPGSAVRALDNCSWDHPGQQPFMGDVVKAVDRYRDIPAAVRARLKERMQARDFDEFVSIERDSISGKADYEPGIRDMHFGGGRVCKTVTRANWTSQMRERGLVYCEQNQCILVPTVCRNVSRITRRPVAYAPPPEGGAPPAAPPEGGGYASVGWLMVQARAVQEPGWIVPRGGGTVLPPTFFMPPFSGGPSWVPESGIPVPVPEAPSWLMMGAGALLVAVLAHRRRRNRGARRT